MILQVTAVLLFRVTLCVFINTVQISHFALHKIACITNGDNDSGEDDCHDHNTSARTQHKCKNNKAL